VLQFRNFVLDRAELLLKLKFIASEWSNLDRGVGEFFGDPLALIASRERFARLALEVVLPAELKDAASVAQPFDPLREPRCSTTAIFNAPLGEVPAWALRAKSTTWAATTLPRCSPNRLRRPAGGCETGGAILLRRPVAERAGVVECGGASPQPDLRA
jgi:hypothetical protein